MLKEWKKLKVFLFSTFFLGKLFCMEKVFPSQQRKNEKIGEKLQNKIEFNKFNRKRTSKSCSVTFLF